MNSVREGLGVARRIVVILLCMFFSSCTKRQAPTHKDILDHASRDELIDAQNKVLDTIVQQEAMLVDIPIPLYDERIIPSDYTIESNTLVFGYKSPLSCAQAVEFFMHQMERYGWQHLVSFEVGQILMQFSSPDRYCTIMVQKGKHDDSCIFIYIKKSEL